MNDKKSNQSSIKIGSAMARSKKIAEETRADKEKLTGRPSSTEDIVDENYQMLANAIIIQAVDDYRCALRVLRDFPDMSQAVARCKEVEDFFLSDWFSILTEVDGKMLIKRLRKESEDINANKKSGWKRY